MNTQYIDELIRRAEIRVCFLKEFLVLGFTKEKLREGYIQEIADIENMVIGAKKELSEYKKDTPKDDPNFPNDFTYSKVISKEQEQIKGEL